MKRICVVGTASIETKFFMDDFPPDDWQIEIKRMYVSIGGSGACMSAMLSKFGFKVDFVTQVGLDTYGEKIMKTLRKININTEYIIQSGSTVQFYSVFNRTFKRKLFIKNINWKEKEILALLPLPLKNADILVLCPTTKSIFTKAISLTKNLKKTLVISPQTAFLEQLNIMRNAFKEANIICLNKKEICSYTNANDFEIAINGLKVQNNQIFIITCGSDGFVVLTKNKVIMQEAINRGKIVDPSGAGDSLAAGVIWALEQGYGLKMVSLIGSIAGFLACKTPMLVEEGFLIEDIFRLMDNTNGGERNK